MEWMTADNDSGQQVPAAPYVFSHINETARIKPELFTSIVEINTDIHTNTPAAIKQLRSLHAQVSDILISQNASLLASSTHPQSHWRQYGGGANMQCTVHQHSEHFAAMVKAMRQQDGWNI